MKKTYLMVAGIVSALILTAIFAGLVITVFIPGFFSPAIAIDPVTDRSLDGNNRLILTGTTTLPVRSFIVIKVNKSIRDPAPANESRYPLAQGYVQVIPGSGGRNFWKGVVDLSSLQPADYTMTFVTQDYVENYSRIVESKPLAVQRLTLGDEQSGPGSIRKRTVTEKPFIRVNAPGPEAPAGTGEITGITSLEPGASLAWRAEDQSPGRENRSSGTGGVAQVTRGTEGVNRWSFPFNATGLRPAPYRITVTGTASGGPASGSPADTVSCSADFNLSDLVTPDKTGTAHPPPGFLAIDSFPEIHTNGVYILTGTTSLPAGEEMIFEVLPYSSGAEIDLIIDPVDKSQVSRNPFSGTSGMIEVEKGYGTINLWALMLETYMMEPGTYVLRINNDKLDSAAMKMIPGGLNSSRVFTVTEGSS